MTRATLVAIAGLLLVASEVHSQALPFSNGYFQPFRNNGPATIDVSTLRIPPTVLNPTRPIAFGTDSNGIPPQPSFARSSDGSIRPAAIAASTDLSGLMGPSQPPSNPGPQPMQVQERDDNRHSTLLPPGRMTEQALAASHFHNDGFHDFAADVIREMDREIAGTPDSPDLVKPLLYLAKLQMVVPESGSARETTRRLERISSQCANLSPDLAALSDYLSALCDCREGRLQDALQRVVQGTPPGLSYNHEIRVLRFDLLMRLSRGKDAGEVARQAREEADRRNGKYSSESVNWAIREFQAMDVRDGLTKSVEALDEYADARTRFGPADAAAIKLDIYRASSCLKRGDFGRAVALLQHTAKIAEAVRPDYVAHLHLCRAYVESRQGNLTAARSAFENAVSAALRPAGETDAVRALRRRVVHFPIEPAAQSKPPDFRDVELDTLFEECAELIVEADRRQIRFRHFPSSLRHDPFFHPETWMTTQTFDDFQRSLGIEWEMAGSPDAASHVGALRVKSVLPASTAEKNGVQKGDRLAAMDGVLMYAPSSIRMVVEHKPAPYKLTLLRNAEEVEVIVSPTTEQPDLVKPSTAAPQVPVATTTIRIPQ